MNTPLPTAASSPDRIDTLRLSLISGVGPRLTQLLLARFGSPAGILAAREEELRTIDGIGPQLAARIVAARRGIDVDGELEVARRHKINMLAREDDAYPRMLTEIHDPPPLLFLRGTLVPDDRLSIAIVGTRHATSYGERMAGRLATSLAAAGLTIVSGLARGIDGVAHAAALAAGGRTIAVTAGGLAEIYPPEHTDLAAQIASRGALLTEAPPRMRPSRGSFPQRNRIISGLSLGVIVVEAAHKSGALITARHACEQGRDVFAVPGRVDQRNSGGCHALLRDGAYLVETADDVLSVLGPLAETVHRDDGSSVRSAAELSLNDLERQVLEAIDTEPTSIDVITRVTGLPVQRVLSTMSVLEMKHLVCRVSGQLVARL